MTAAAGIASCQILASWPDGRSLKAAGLSLEILPSGLEGAAESGNDFSALVTALNRVGQIAEAADRAAADAQQALANAQARGIGCERRWRGGKCGCDFGRFRNRRRERGGRRRGAAVPDGGPADRTEDVTVVIGSLTAYLFRGAVTAQKADSLGRSAQGFDAMAISALDFDTDAKTILRVA